MNEYYVYRYIRLDTNTPFHVGKGKKRRAFLLKHHRNQYFINIVNSIPYELEFMLEDLSEKQAFLKEMEFIKLYKTLGYCETNLTDGGEGVSGLKMPDTMKKKMSIYRKGKKHSRETKNKIRFSGIGRKNLSACKKIQCIENGQIFESIKILIEFYKISRNTLFRNLKYNKKIVKLGLSFKYL